MCDFVYLLKGMETEVGSGTGRVSVCRTFSTDVSKTDERLVEGSDELGPKPRTVR